METNRVFDIIIDLIIGIKNENKLVEKNGNNKVTLNNCSYLLNQIIRQIQLPRDHYFVSEKALALWNSISSNSIFDYTYRDTVTKDIPGIVTIYKFRGGEGTPKESAQISIGDKFIFKDVFTDEHIVTVSNIIDELLNLEEYDYTSISEILDKLYICKMLKSEDRAITSKKNRSTDYRRVIINDYREVGISLVDFDYSVKIRDIINELKSEMKNIENELQSSDHKEQISVVTEAFTATELNFPFAVEHDNHGIGKALSLVKKNENVYIKIDFGDNVKEFLYPDQFMIHLKADNPKIQQTIEKIFDENQKIDQNSPFLLQTGDVLNSTAQDSYNDCCKKFGWDSSQDGKFAKQQKLYARNVTPENYSVWMIVHNNLNEAYNNTRSWFNIVEKDVIKEIWFTEDKDLLSDNSTRVTFAKTKNGYQFQGIYKPTKTEHEIIHGKLECVRTFERISNSYPNYPKSTKNTPPPPNKRMIEIYFLEENTTKTLCIDDLNPSIQKSILEKNVGDIFSFIGNKNKKCKITKILF